MDLFSKRTFSSHGSPLTVGVTFQPFFSHGTPLFSHGTFFCHFQPRDTHGTRRTFVYVHVGARGALSMGSRAVVVHGHGSPVLLVPAVRSPQAVVRRKSVTRLLLRFVGDEPILGPQGGSRNDDFFGKNHLTWWFCPKESLWVLAKNAKLTNLLIYYILTSFDEKMDKSCCLSGFWSRLLVNPSKNPLNYLGKLEWFWTFFSWTQCARFRTPFHIRHSV